MRCDTVAFVDFDEGVFTLPFSGKQCQTGMPPLRILSWIRKVEWSNNLPNVRD